MISHGILRDAIWMRVSIRERHDASVHCLALILVKRLRDSVMQNSVKPPRELTAVLEPAKTTLFSTILKPEGE